MLYVKFEYRDEFNYPNWSQQECWVSNIQQVYDIYGLNSCEHRILDVKDTKKHKELVKDNGMSDRNADAAEVGRASDKAVGREER